MGPAFPPFSMKEPSLSWPRAWLSRSAPLLAGLLAVAAARLLTLPESLWEWDEVLFVRGVVHYDPLHHSPHPPGYPLLIGLGKAVSWIAGDPFASLVALSVIASCIGFVALAAAFRSFVGGGAPGERAGVAGALLFHFSPSMLVYGPLALSDSAALMFLSLALAAAGRLAERPGALPAALFGVFASAAIGCRPQLALAVLPVMAVTLALAGGWKVWGSALAAFTAVSLAWFVPLVAAVGGPSGLLPFLGKQAGLVVAYDTAEPRGGMSWKGVVARFLAHPWGDRWTSVPVLLLAAGGAVAAARRLRASLPLAVLTAVELTFALAVMNPRDAVRYALPGMLGLAFAAGLGAEWLARRLRVPFAAYALAALIAAGAVRYTAPLLSVRSRVPSPPVQAIWWAAENLPPETVFLVDKQLAAHLDYLLPRSERLPVDEGLRRYAGRRTKPVYLLGEGESGWPGAQTFRWPASDAYGKLTRDLYRVVSLSPIPPRRRHLAGRGVYAYEPSTLRPEYRWLGPDAALRLFPAGERRVGLTLAVPGSAPWPANRVTVTLGGVAAEVEVPRGERRSLVLALPAAGEVEIGFRSAASFVPVETGGGSDTRRLAVQLVSLELLEEEEAR